MVPNNYTLGVSISKSQGVVTPLIGRRVRKKKGSGRGGLIYKYDSVVYMPLA